MEIYKLENYTPPQLFITFLKRYIQNDELVILFYKFCKENNVNLAVNAGTTALKKGAKYFSQIFLQNLTFIK